MRRANLSLLLILIMTGLCVGQSRFERLLTSKREAIRLRAIGDLADNPTMLRGAMNDVLKAVSTAEQEALTLPDAALAPSTTRLIFLLASIRHDLATTELIRLLDSKRPEIVMSTADAIGTYKHHESALDSLIRQTSRDEFDADFGFRVAILRSISRIPKPEAVRFLSQQELRLKGQLRYSVHETLNKVTAFHFGGDTAQLEAWKLERTRLQSEAIKAAQASQAAADAEDAKPASSPDRIVLNSDTPKDYRSIELTRSTYYGMPLVANRLVFVLDRSGSMDEVSSGFSRLERAKRELIQAINELPQATQFTIIFFESGVKVWREELLQATEENKRSAKSFLARIDPGDRTNTHGALEKALRMEGTETVFLLSDGIPTTGRVVAPILIVEAIRELNRFKNITINTIGVALSPQTTQFMRALATESGGEFRAVH